MAQLRSVICSVLGHVDHGKSSILDRIRGTAIVKSEAGQITQSIGASIIPLDVVKNICGPLLRSLNLDFTIPGLLLIDTPGHAAFTNLRKRGGNLADIAILVIDLREGFKPQTLEAVDILRHYKTPFVVAANKVDLMPGWRSTDTPLIQNIRSQGESLQKDLDVKIYEIVGKLSELGFQSDRFDRVESYANQVAIVPCSAKTGEGIPELLMVIAGLGQKFLEDSLKFEVGSPAKGTILEVKRDRGLGTTIDVIIYDGTVKKGDTIIVGGLHGPIQTKVKALFEPLPLSEMRDKKAQYQSVHQVSAATGVKVSALGIDSAVAGMPFRVANENALEIKEEIMRDVESVTLQRSKIGVVVKADSLGSLEAVLFMLKEKEIPVRKAQVGSITRKDIYDAESNSEQNPLLTVVLGFNVPLEPEASEELRGTHVAVFTSDVIYSLADRYEKWKEGQKKAQEQKALGDVVRPCRIQLLRGYVFRQHGPAIVGVDVQVGMIKVGMPLMKEDAAITTVKGIQLERESISSAQAGKQVAVSLDQVTLGRQIDGADILYSAIPEDDFRELKKYKDLLSTEERNVMKEIAEKKRKNNPMWGV